MGQELRHPQVSGQTNEIQFRAELSAASPVQTSSRNPSRKRAVLLTALVSTLAVVCFVFLLNQGQFAAKKPSRLSLLLENEQNPTTYCLNGDGYVKPLMGSIEVSRVDGIDNDFFYLSILGTPGHHITAILEGSDGYQKNWDNYGSIWAGDVHKQSVRGQQVVDYLQVQDQMTGETAWFRFPCGDGAINGVKPTPKLDELPDALCFANNSEGFRKQTMSEISLSKINDFNGDCYYLSVQGPVGHQLTVILEGSDGYHRHWANYGAVWSGCVAKNDGTGKRPVSHDFLQVQDEQTGEVQYFEWPCRGTALASSNGLALDFPPQCADQKDTGGGLHKGTCFAPTASSCALCITGDGLCKPTLGTTTVKKVDGQSGLDNVYFLYILGDAGHPIKAILTGSDGFTRKWENFGQIWADNIYKPGHAGRPADAVDHLQVQDSITGDINFFQFPCVGDSLTAAPIAIEAPAPAPAPLVAAPPAPAPAPAPASAPIEGEVFVEGYAEAPPGPAGPAGPPGADAVKVIKVIPGPPGPAGPPGKSAAGAEVVLQGPPGPAGPAGPDGRVVTRYDGPKVPPAGTVGPRGPRGAEGVKVIKTLPGPPGPPGPPGRSGASEEVVVHGPPGPAGPAGADGQVVTKYFHAVEIAGGATAQPPLAAVAAVGDEKEAEAQAAAWADQGCAWSYSGSTGPAQWGALCEGKYALCATGKRQSPIDFRRLEAVVRAGEAGATLGWRIPAAGSAAQYVGRQSALAAAPSAGAALESFGGHTFEVSHVDATMDYGGASYRLKRFQTRTPSEHLLDGERFPLEIQFIHEPVAAGGRPLIVSAFFRAVGGRRSPEYLRTLVAALPLAGGTPQPLAPVDVEALAQSVMVGSLPHLGAGPAGFVPNFKGFLSYSGSYTVPPCAEGVEWVLLPNPVYVSAEDVAALAAREGGNARPVQARNGRALRIAAAAAAAES